MSFNNFKHFSTLFFLLFSILECVPSFAVSPEELIEGFKEVTSQARVVLTHSREEAFEDLKAHCEKMISYHRDMAAMFEDRQNRYKECLEVGGMRKDMDLFLEHILGVPVPKNQIPPIRVINNFLIEHNNHLDSWLGHLAILTGEEQILSNRKIFKPPLVLGEATEQNACQFFSGFKKDIAGSYSSFLKEFNLNSQDDLKTVDPKYFSLCQIRLDFLWGLEEAQSLMLLWALPEEKRQEIQQKYAQEEREKQAELVKKERKREKNKKRNLKRKQNKIQSKIMAEPSKEEYISQNGKVLAADTEQPEANEQSELITPVRRAETTPKETETKPENIVTEENTPYNYEEWVGNEKYLSQIKKQNELIPVSKKKTAEDIAKIVSPRFEMDKEPWGYFMDLFESKNLAFSSFVKAFEKGLGGSVKSNTGGSMRTFQSGKFSFILHKPHGHKGEPMFYDELRKRAKDKLEILGVTKDTLLLRNAITQ